MVVAPWIKFLLKELFLPFITDIIKDLFFHPTKETVYETKSHENDISSDIFANP